ncbi:MAG: hypothetical protein ABI045_02540 [Flavobacteriales bacterium]
MFYFGISIYKRVLSQEYMEIKTFFGSEVLKKVYKGRYGDLIKTYGDLKKYACKNGFTISANGL